MGLKYKYHSLRLILGDQLNRQHSWYQTTDDNILYVIAELKQETNYVKHHIQKLCAFFLSMETFAKELTQGGHQVLHLTLDKTAGFQDLEDLIASLVAKYSVKRFQYQRPDEYRLLKQLRNLTLNSDIAITEVDTEHFLLPFSEISHYIKPKQHNRMEAFYRKLRKRFNLLMDDGQPMGGTWNYDQQNREKLKPEDLDAIPQPLLFGNPIAPLLKRLSKHKIAHFGSIGESLIWPVSRDQSLQLLDHFCRDCLPQFGRFQDAMIGDHPHRWTLYHSRLSFALNTKMLSPEEVIARAIDAFNESQGDIDLPQIEGFVRQILGWREYVRGVYWANMPDYARQNTLDANRNLPGFFWSGKTDMACLKQAIQQSLDYAYAHHIQRLMITGNFCLLTGINPDQVDAWYLGIYIDAIEWVEMPNTRGMSQYADSGWVATKPYTAGGNYVNKMSDYCKPCAYNVKEKATDTACPLNSLYWAFMHKHRKRLESNPRTNMVYRNWDKQSVEQRNAVLERANWCLDNLDSL